VAGAVVKDVLFHIANLRSIRIESHNPESLAPFGLDQSAVRLTLGLSGDGGIQKTVIMGFRSRTDGIYAMVQGQDVVFVLEKGLADLLSRDLVVPPAAKDTPGKDTSPPSS
jgi:hypothetical protein